LSLCFSHQAISKGSHDPFLIFGDVQGNGYLSKYTSLQPMLHFRFFPTLHRSPLRSPSTPSPSSRRPVLAGPILRHGQGRRVGFLKDSLSSSRGPLRGQRCGWSWQLRTWRAARSLRRRIPTFPRVSLEGRGGARRSLEMGRVA
jgi:hypothetical protein